MGGDLLQQYPALSSLLFYGTICLVKTLCMAFLTARQRFAKNVFANPEDAQARKANVSFSDPDVERVRRNHLNDLENVPLFILIAVFYVLTYPTPSIALWHFRIFTVSRLLHTVTYQLGIQPFRALLFMVGLVTTLSMAVQVLIAMA